MLQTIAIIDIIDNDRDLLHTKLIAHIFKYIYEYSISLKPNYCFVNVLEKLRLKYRNIF